MDFLFGWRGGTQMWFTQILNTTVIKSQSYDGILDIAIEMHEEQSLMD